MYNSDNTAGLVLSCYIERNIVFFNLSCPLLGMPQLCEGNQTHPYNWAVVSCSQKYKYDINSLVMVASSKCVSVTIQLGWEIQFGVLSGLIFMSLDVSKSRW